MYPAITKQVIEELAQDIYKWLSDNEYDDDVCIYYNHKRINTYHGYNVEDNISVKDYCEYVPDNHILTIASEGSLYDIYAIMYEMPKPLRKMWEKLGLYEEAGESWYWSLSLSDRDECYEGQTEYDVYVTEEPEFIYHNDGKSPVELDNIMNYWYNASKATGDRGSCVIGAGFNFDWKDKKWFMSSCSPWQGSMSWEAHVETIKQLLHSIGALNIQYDYGVLD